MTRKATEKIIGRRSIPFSHSCVTSAAEIRSKLKNAGRLIGPYDILIAGTALVNDMIMVTSNLNKFSHTNLPMGLYRHPLIKIGC